MNAQRFDFYGVAIRVESSSDELLDSIRRDFWYFRAQPGEAGHRIVAHLNAPDYPERPGARPLAYTPRNVTYRDGGTIYIDYFGRALLSWTIQERLYEISSDVPDLAQEVLYLTILSLVGEQLDRRAIHRVHALGIAYHGRAALITLPPGGGKTTLLTTLIRQPGVRLLSEDSPLLTRSGQVLAFPLRLGFVPGREPDAPPQFVRHVQRMEFGPKALVDIEYYKDKLADRAEPGAIFLGQRALSAHPSIRRATRTEALKNLARHCIIGLGLYQGLEFAVQHGITDLLGRAHIAWSRLRNCNALARRSQLHHFRIGRDSDANVALLLEKLAEWRRN